MVYHSLRGFIAVPLWIISFGLVSAYDECLLGFGLQGLDPFESTDWVGLPVCDESLAAAEVLTNYCTTYWTYSCFWSVVVGCTENDDDACTCQACGGMPPDLDEYMWDLPLWDRARCAVYALEEAGYDVTPCVEAIVDSMSMPGVTDSWTAPAVAQTECLAIEYGSYHTHAACSFAGTPRFATEVFDGDAEDDADDDAYDVVADDDANDDTTASSLVSSYDECLLGFGLQGLDPFESTDWVGLPVCDESLAAAEVLTNYCTTYWTYSCFWSVVVGCTEDDDDACTCQACGGMPPDLDEYMWDLPLWDRARCAVYALEEAGYDVTPCVEAIVDSMSMPGVTDSWTAPAVAQTECLAIEYGSYHTHAACSFAGTPRFATEVFDTASGTTPTAGTPAPVAGGATGTTSSLVAATTPAPLLVSEAPVSAESDGAYTASPDVPETVGPGGDVTPPTPASLSSAETTSPSVGEEGGVTGPNEGGTTEVPATATPAPVGDAVGGDPTAGSDTASNNDSNTTNDIVIGVATTVVSAVILGVAKKMFSNRSSPSSADPL